MRISDFEDRPWQRERGLRRDSSLNRVVRRRWTFCLLHEKESPRAAPVTVALQRPFSVTSIGIFEAKVFPSAECEFFFAHVENLACALVVYLCVRIFETKISPSS